MRDAPSVANAGKLRVGRRKNAQCPAFHLHDAARRVLRKKDGNVTDHQDDRFIRMTEGNRDRRTSAD
jgi:hypothetical protein